MGKKVVLFIVTLMFTVSLSGCLHDDRGNGELSSAIRIMGSSDEVDAEDYNVLYIGHSFGKVFAETLQDYAHTAGFTNHSEYIEFSGGASGAPDRLWADDGHRENIKDYLDTGEIDVLIMICCSLEFIGQSGITNFTDEAIHNFTAYAVGQNPDVRIGLSMPWKDFPGDYENASQFAANSTLDLWPYWVNLSQNLSAEFPTNDIFTFHHGAVAYELREMFEAGELEGDIEQLQGPRQTSVFTDEKGHAGQITIDTGTLIWLHAVHGFEPLDMPEFTQWNTDIRVIADSLLDAQYQEGCTDFNATNYDENATVDDGSCEYPPPPVPGCMDSNATNYDENATMNDDSCAYLPLPEPPIDDDDTPIDDDDNEDSGDIESETPEKSGFLGNISMMNIVLVFDLVLLLSLLTLFKIAYNRR